MRNKGGNLKRKITFQFVTQYIIFVALSLCLISLMLIYSFQKLVYTEYLHDLTRATTEYIEKQIRFDGTSVEIKEELIDAIENQDGWLQVVDIHSLKVEHSVNTPKDINQEYNIAELNSVIKNEFLSNYEYKTWKINLNHLVIFGVYSQSKNLIKTMVDRDLLSDEVSQDLNLNNNYWYALYGGDGRLKKSSNIPAKEQAMILNIIISNTDKGKSSEYNIATTKINDGDFLIVGSPNKQIGEHDYLENKLGWTVLLDLLILFVTIIVLLFVISSYYAKQWGEPIVGIIGWIQDLAMGKYDSPYARKKLFKSKNKKLFNEVTTSLSILTDELKTKESYREELEKMREEWIAGLSHDLKTPLSSVMGYSILLKDNTYQWSPDEIQKFGKTIADKAEYIDSLIDDLNLTYRLKYGAVPLNKQTVDVDELIRDLVIDYINHPEHVELDIIYSNNTTHQVFYDFDKKQFKRVIDNLLANAIKYSDTQKVRIEVALNHLKNGFEISIQDNGIGMDDKTKKNLFNRYYRGTSTTEKPEGTGLGLAITKELVEIHEGKISVSSELTKGTQISLVFDTIT
ncbi:MAG: sensor histidine kinase [Bacillus sp. (in: firmicutes)]